MAKNQEDKFKKVRMIDAQGNAKMIPSHLADALTRSHGLTLQDLPEKKVKEQAPAIELSSLKVAELKELAAKNKLPIEDYDLLHKAELIEYLEGKKIKA